MGDEIVDVAENSKWVKSPNLTTHEIRHNGVLGKELMVDPPQLMVMASIPDAQMRAVRGSALGLGEFENIVRIPKERLKTLQVRKDGNSPYYNLDGELER